MNEKTKYGPGFKANRLPKGVWSFGSCLSHGCGETYLFINFLFWTVCVGWMAKDR